MKLKDPHINETSFLSFTKTITFTDAHVANAFFYVVNLIKFVSVEINFVSNEITAIMQAKEIFIREGYFAVDLS